MSSGTLVKLNGVHENKPELVHVSVNTSHLTFSGIMKTNNTQQELSVTSWSKESVEFHVCQMC